MRAGVLDRISVGIGARLLELIPGRVSTECDARLAYDTEATIAKGRRLVGLYADRGVPVDRIYIKIASTWEGVKACEQLQMEGISTNMTLLFDFCQVSNPSHFFSSLHSHAAPKQHATAGSIAARTVHELRFAEYARLRRLLVHVHISVVCISSVQVCSCLI
jgi:transaldolase